MTSARRWFYTMVAAQGLFLIVWAGWNEMQLARSPTILLDTRPVDPMEILRGDYITMNYVIAHPQRSLLVSGGHDPVFGEPVCVTLAPSGKFHEVVEIRRDPCPCPPADDSDRIELNGEVTYGFGPAEDLWIDYGIGRFYVPEGKGSPRGALTARVAVTPWCRAMIREVYLDGEPYP